MTVDRVLGAGRHSPGDSGRRGLVGIRGREPQIPRRRVLAAAHRRGMAGLGICAHPAIRPGGPSGRDAGVPLGAASGSPLARWHSTSSPWSRSGTSSRPSSCSWCSSAGWRAAPGGRRCLDRGPAARSSSFVLFRVLLKVPLPVGMRPAAARLVTGQRGSVVDTIGPLLHGFAVALTPGNLLYVLLGTFIGTVIGVLPGLGADRLHRAAAPRHHRHGHGLGPDLPGGDLLRGHVRRVDHLDPGEHPGRGGLGRHLHRRLPDGPAGAGRPGARHVGLRLLHRRNRRRGGRHAHLALPGRGGPQVRAARDVRAALLRLHLHRRPDGKVAGARPSHGLRRAAPRHGGNGRHPRGGPVHLRDALPAGRDRPGAAGHGSLRPGGDPLQHRAAGRDRLGAGDPQEPPAHPAGLEGFALAHRPRQRAGVRHRDSAGRHAGGRLALELCRREARRQTAGAVRHGSHRGGGGARDGEQRRYRRRIRAAAHAGDSHQQRPGAHAGGPDAPRGHAGAAPALLKWPDVFWGVIASMYIGNVDAPGPQPAHDRTVRPDPARCPTGSCRP